MARSRKRTADLIDRGARALDDRLARRRAALDGTRDALRTLSPLATLERGYAIARSEDGRIIRDAAELDAGERLQVMVARGTVETRVEETRPDANEELLR